MAALCSVEEPSSVEAVEHQLDVIHSLRNDVEIFTQKMKSKLSAMEDALQKQVEDLSHTEAVANEMTETEGRRGRTTSMEDQISVEEPAALIEHRQKKFEASIGWYWPLGTVSSLTQTTTLLGNQKEVRLHNRWMQLSMQTEAVLALSEYRRMPSLKGLKHAPSYMSGGPPDLPLRLFHPLGKTRVIWDLCGLLLLIVDTILLPLSLAFGWTSGTQDAGSFILLLDFIASVFFWTLDIFMNVNTAFYSKGALVYDRHAIVRRYVKTWCVLDVCVVVLDYVTLANVLAEDRGADLTVLRFARIIRAFRLVRLLKIARFDDLMQEIAASTGRQWIMLVVAIINTTVAILLIAHVMTCIWVGVGEFIQRDDHWLALAALPDDRWSEYVESVPIPVLTPWVKYLHAFRYVMASPSPPVMAPDSAEERLFDIMTSIFTFVVIGGAISKISGTVVELRGMNEAKSKQRCEIRHYLQSQDASFELVSRVMKFAEYKLEKMMPTSFDPSLISLTLQTELSVNQRSRYIKQVPIFDLTSQLWPEVFSSICVVLRKVVCENREDVFVAGGLSTALYITVTGEYSHVEGYDGQGEVTELSGVTYLEELSLYVDALAHQSSLMARTFAEMFTLDGDSLVKCLGSAPSCAAMFFEYAKEFTMAVKKAGGRASLEIQTALSERCCKKTQIYQDMYPDQETRLSNIDLSHIVSVCVNTPTRKSTSSEWPMMQMDTSNGLGETQTSGPVKGAELIWLIEVGWPNKLVESEISEQLQTTLPEISPDHGPHVLFEQGLERDRAESSCICTLALVHNRYDIFTNVQPPSAKLLTSQWDQLQEIVSWIRPTKDKIHAVLVLLAIRSLGKSKSVTNQVPKGERSPESVVLHLIDNFKNVVPSVQALSDEGLMYAKGALNLHAIFNLAQMLQGENVPANVFQLQENVKRDGSEVLRFYILFLLGFMSGLNAGRGSKFMTARRAENVIEGVRMLKYLLEASACGIYWGYLEARAHVLNVPFLTPEDLVLVRLACLARVEDRNAYRQLQEAWHTLGANERTTLLQHFLADGIEDMAFVFEFLPDCVANAVRNPAIGLTCLLELLVCLLHMLQPAASGMMANMPGAKVVLVNLSDMSEFIACVRNRFIFETSISRCKVRFAHGRVQLEMTGSNWARVNEPNSDITSLAYSVKDVLQKQRQLETQILKGLRFGSGLETFGV